MIYMTLSEAAFTLNIDYSGNDVAFEGVSTDTRTLEPGNLFVAIVGENFDGHDFIEQAKEKGAAAAIVSRMIKTQLPLLTVRDTGVALGKLAQAWRAEFSACVIGLTGSHGKTTTKEMIAAILNKAAPGEVLVNQGSFNNYIGVPHTLFQLNKHHQFAVIEMGMNAPGEIDYLSRIADPDIALVTNASGAHLQGLGTVENVARAKGELFEGLHHDGIAIVNADDRFARDWLKTIGTRKSTTFGIDNKADISAKITTETAEMSEFILSTPIGECTIRLPFAGKHNVANAIAAAAVAITTEAVTLEHIAEGLASFDPAPGRGRVYTHISGAQIIDESYNCASLSAVHAVANALALYPEPRIMIFADMKELKDDEAIKHVHAEAGNIFKQAGINKLYTYGEDSRHTTESFGEGAKHFTDKTELTTALQQNELKPGHTLLFKGARSMALETIIKTLLNKETIE